jgi:hypothetical protein
MLAFDKAINQTIDLDLFILEELINVINFVQ